MGKSKYKRDWHKYDENVVMRYTLMFPSTSSNTGGNYSRGRIGMQRKPTRHQRSSTTSIPPHLPTL
jgi:hypothetical protein